tara:strand:- start:7851 stop:8102 length:252 start_codon:yes stop_codon:yes gene_type:complete
MNVYIVSIKVTTPYGDVESVDMEFDTHAEAKQAIWDAEHRSTFLGAHLLECRLYSLVQEALSIDNRRAMMDSIYSSKYSFAVS